MMHETPVLETERLIISHGQIEDYVKVHEYDFNYLEDIDGIFKYVKRDSNEVRSWFSQDETIEKHYERLELKKSFNYIIYLKETKEPIGNIAFDRYNHSKNSLEISCYIHPSYWGQRYAKEALIATMDYIYDLGFDNIIYGYYKGNIKSEKNCKNIGFEYYEQKETNNFLGNKSIEYRYIMSKDKFKSKVKK